MQQLELLSTIDNHQILLKIQNESDAEQKKSDIQLYFQQNGYSIHSIEECANKLYDTDIKFICAEQKKSEIHLFLEKNGYSLYEFGSEHIDDIYDILINGIIKEDYDDIHRNYYSYCAIYYEDKKNTNQVIKFYTMSAEKGDKNAIQNLFSTVKENYDKETAFNHILKLIEKNNKNAMDIFIKECKNTLEQCLLLNGIDNKNKLIIDQLNILKKIYKVRCFIRKIEHLSKTDNCPICMIDNLITIPMECSHFFCTKCYIKLQTCPYNCAN